MMPRLFTDSVLRGLCACGVDIHLPFRNEEQGVALAASPSTGDMIALSFMYPHAVAARTLCYGEVVLSPIRHGRIIRGDQFKNNKRADSRLPSL
jgi:hypothetical protein